MIGTDESDTIDHPAKPNNDEITSETRFTQLESDSKKLKVPTLKDASVLDNHIANEGNIPTKLEKCKECLHRNCKSCLKVNRSDPAQTAVIEEMRENIERLELPDGTRQYQVKYSCYKPSCDSFPANVSNYEGAIKQARENFSKILVSKGGVDAIDEMIDRSLR